MGDASLVDSMIHDGLWCAFEHCHMGVSGEHVAEIYDVSREAQDRYAAESHQKAARAAAEGRFTPEIVRVEIPQPKGPLSSVDRDETIRPDSTVDVLGNLKPAFKKDGSVTAGNAPGVNDGAAAVVVMSEERAASLGITPMARSGRLRDERHRAEVTADDTGRSHSKSPETYRLAARRRRPLRDQRSFRRADGRDHQRTGTRSRPRQRQRRRDRARASDRRQRRTGPDDVAVRDEGAKGQTRRRVAVPGRREWRGDWRWKCSEERKTKKETNRDQRDTRAFFVFLFVIRFQRPLLQWSSNKQQRRQRARAPSSPRARFRE